MYSEKLFKRKEWHPMLVEILMGKIMWSCASPLNNSILQKLLLIFSTACYCILRTDPPSYFIESRCKKTGHSFHRQHRRSGLNPSWRNCEKSALPAMPLWRPDFFSYHPRTFSEALASIILMITCIVIMILTGTWFIRFIYTSPIPHAPICYCIQFEVQNAHWLHQLQMIPITNT